MAFQVSPGVQIKEIDLSNVVPAVSSTVGAFAGVFQWGPVDEVKTVSSGQQLVDEFYKPADSDLGTEDFYSADSFLRYGSALKVVRISNSAMKSANSSGASSALLKNETDYESTYESGGQNGTVGRWISKYAGVLGNSLQVSVCASNNAYFNSGASAINNADGYDVGATTVTVDAGANFVVGDIIKFAHAQKYKITDIASNALTIQAIGESAGTGLLTAVADDESVDRWWEHYALFDKAPGTSAHAEKLGASNDELHVVVVDEDGAFSGSKGTVLETHGFLSLGSDAKDEQGESNYYRDVIARQSGYVYWTGHSTLLMGTGNEAQHRTLSTAVSTAFVQEAEPINDSLSGGADATAPTTVEKISAWDAFFADAETQDFSFLVIGSTRSNNGDTVSDHNTLVNSAVSLAELRKDCLVIASPRKTSIVNVSSEASQLANVEADFTNVTSSSYLVIDSGWVYQYDRFNDKYVWVPGNGHTAGIMARSDLLQDPWYSPAGFSRGQYLGITKLAFNPKQASRDELYRKRINPIVTFPGQGTVLFGDKTGLASPSAFDRINVRRLFIVLEKAISIAAKAQLFEFNDAFTRAQFRSAVEPFLRDVKNRRGLIDFSVVCDESNNTDSVIDRNEFVCSIFVKPAKSINFITLNFVASRSGVEFEEIYGAV
jgi:phage tail sheath protein FI